jgi:hypothetical protein
VSVSVVEDETLEHGPDAAAPVGTSRADLMAARRTEREARTRLRRRRLVRRTIIPLCLLLAASVVVVALSSGGVAPRSAAHHPTTGSGTGHTSPAPATRAAGGVAGAGAPLPVPTATAPLRVLVVGDGLAQDVGRALTSELAPSGLAAVTVDGRPGSGLVTSTPVDWSAAVAADVARRHPSLVVVVLGSNDQVAIAGSSGSVPYGSAGWLAAYEGLVRRFDAQITATGARVLWVGMPPMSSAATSTAMLELDGVFQDVALSSPGTVYLGSWALLSSPTGSFTATLTGTSGARVTVRSADGQRLTPTGAALVSKAVVAVIDESWQLRLRP